MVQRTHESNTTDAGDEETEAQADAEIKAAQEAGRVALGAVDADVDAILDEIDEVLEANAQEFVKGFVQKGGQ